MDSFLDDNINPNKVKVEYKKTPIILGENIVCAVQIDFTVNNLVREVEITSGDDWINSMKELVQGKSNKEKEEILDNIIKNSERRARVVFEPKTLEELYDYNGLEGENRNLTELATSEGITQEMADSDGVELDEELIINYIINTGGAPYYRLDEQSEKAYRTYINECEIITADSRVEKVGKEFNVYENDTYNFSAKVPVTGETIEVQVPVTEITAEYGTDYEYISNGDQRCCGLKDKEDKYEKFEEAYAIYKGKIYNIREAIKSRYDSDLFDGRGHYDDDGYDYLDANDVSEKIKEIDGNYPKMYETCTLIIIKNNKSYHGNMSLILLG